MVGFESNENRLSISVRQESGKETLLENRGAFINPAEHIIFLYQILKPLALLESNGISHGHLSPEVIFFERAHGRYVLADPQVGAEGPAALQRRRAETGEVLFASPWVFEEVVGRPPGRGGAFKNDTFSLALVLVSLVAGQDAIQRVCDAATGRFDAEALAALKNRVFLRFYDDPSMKGFGTYLLDSMLSTEPQRCPLPSQALRLIKQIAREFNRMLAIKAGSGPQISISSQASSSVRMNSDSNVLPGSEKAGIDSRVVSSGFQASNADQMTPSGLQTHYPSNTHHQVSTSDKVVPDPHIVSSGFQNPSYPNILSSNASIASRRSLASKKAEASSRALAAEALTLLFPAKLLESFDARADFSRLSASVDPIISDEITEQKFLASSAGTDCPIEKLSEPINPVEGSQRFSGLGLSSNRDSPHWSEILSHGASELSESSDRDLDITLSHPESFFPPKRKSVFAGRNPALFTSEVFDFTILSYLPSRQAPTRSSRNFKLGSFSFSSLSFRRKSTREIQSVFKSLLCPARPELLAISFAQQSPIILQNPEPLLLHPPVRRNSSFDLSILARSRRSSRRESGIGIGIFDPLLSSVMSDDTRPDEVPFLFVPKLLSSNFQEFSSDVFPTPDSL